MTGYSRSMAKLSVLVLTLLMSAAAFTHHSDAGLDMKSEVTVEGKVVEFKWINPHVYFTLQSTNSSKPGTWEVQLASIPPLSRAGWSQDALKPGDLVVARLHPASTPGRTYGMLISMQKNGKPFPEKSGAASEAQLVPAKSIEGKWRQDRSTSLGFTEFFDRLVLTDKGRAAKDKFDELSVMNPMSTCIGRPTPATVVSSGAYLSQIEFKDKTIILRNEIFDSERTVYMDGRPHPKNGPRTLEGHSIGHWEGDTLVVDTTLFTDHRSPYQNGVPSGSKKHVVEKYRLKEGGTRIAVEVMLEDPEFIAKPLVSTMEWIHAPELNMQRWNCNEASTKAFLPDQKRVPAK